MIIALLILAASELTVSVVLLVLLKNKIEEIHKEVKTTREEVGLMLDEFDPRNFKNGKYKH